jgi:hypothetical protein
LIEPEANAQMNHMYQWPFCESRRGGEPTPCAGVETLWNTPPHRNGLQRKLPNEPISIDSPIKVNQGESSLLKVNQGESRLPKKFLEQADRPFYELYLWMRRKCSTQKGGRRHEAGCSHDSTALAGVGLAHEQLARPPAFPIPLRFLAGLNA